MKTPPLGRRFLARAGGSLLAVPLNLALQAVVPRTLGPTSYGNYSYLSAWFTETIGFLEGGSSSAFFAKWSQRPKEDGIASFFSLIIAAIGIVLPALVLAAFGLGLSDRLWPGLTGLVVGLAAVMAYGNWLISVATRAVDVHGQTTLAEIAVLAVRALLVIAAISMASFHWLGLESFLALQAVLNMVVVVALLGVLRTVGKAHAFFTLSRASARTKYGREFWTYSHPLLTFAFLAVISNLADRWLLQRLGGAAQQGFFGLSSSVAAVIFLLAGSLVSLLTREFAQAHSSGDLDGLKKKFVTLVPATYAATAALGMFCAIEADHILLLLGGSDYREARLALTWMCVYPMHQAYGQLNGALMMATDRTAVYRNIGTVGLALGPVMTYWLLADPGFGGLGLGGGGLAIKMVLVQFLIVNVQLAFIVRVLQLRQFGMLLRHQVTTPLLLALLAWLSRQGVAVFSGGPLPSFLCTAVVYFAALGVVLVFMPKLLLPRTLNWRSLLAQINPVDG